MLKFLKISNPVDLQNVIQNYDPLLHTWVVSDLKSKNEIQSLALEKYSYFTDDAIMRVSDFWRLWIRRLAPKINVISSDFVRVLVQKFVDEINSAEKNPLLLAGEVATLNRAVQEFAPLLLHPASRELMQEWVTENQKSGVRSKKWLKWYQWADRCIDYIVNEHHAIDAKWSAAYLQSLDLQNFKWNRPMFVDLGSELSPVEFDLFKLISQDQDVYFISPAPAWMHKFSRIKKVYDSFEGYGEIQNISSASQDAVLKPGQFLRLSTQLAEIKFATAQIRKWAEQGVPLSRMAVVAADIEAYWPSLQLHFDVEGLAVRKDRVVRIGGLSDIQTLLARLQSLTDEVSWESLEKTVYSFDTQNEKSFESFKALFYQLFDEDDLARDQKIKNLFYKKIDLKSQIDRDELTSLLVKIWTETPASQMKDDLFEVVFKDILAQALNVKLKARDWISFLRERLSRKEITLSRGQEGGVQVLSLMSAHMLNTPYKIYLGLNDEFYNRRQNRILNQIDAQKINDDLGLQIDYSDESDLEFNLRWQSLAAGEETYFTSAHLGFAAEPLNAALFFIENNPVSQNLISPPTRLDELQKNWRDLSRIELKNQASVRRLRADVEGEQIRLAADKFKSLSVNDFNQYTQCSFKLLASRGFKLRDYAQVSIDLDPREKGNLFHKLFEYLVHELAAGTNSKEKTENFLEEKRQEFKLYQQADHIWAVQKTKFLAVAERFIQIEKDRVRNYNIQTEKELTLYFDIEKKQFTSQAAEHSFVFKMRADRIDTHKTQQFCVVYDYKTASDSKRNYNNWISEKDFQMLLYVLALRFELPEPSLVKGALYYPYKTFKIAHGYADDGIAKSELGLKTGAVASVDKLKKVEDEFQELATHYLTQLNEGFFSAEPSNQDNCADCDWSKLCRAVHLN